MKSQKLYLILFFLLIFSQTLEAQELLPLNQKDVPVIKALDFRDMDIRDGLKFIAEQGRLNIVGGSSLKGRVTVRLENMLPYDALRVVLESAQLAYEEREGVIHILTAHEYELKYGTPFGRHIKTEVIYLVGIKPSVAVDFLERIKSPFGKIIANDASGTLFLEDTPLKLEQMREYCAVIDMPLEEKIYLLEFLSLEEGAEHIRSLITPQVGSFFVDYHANTLVVTDTTEVLGKLGALFNQIDVSVEPSVMDLNYAQAKDIAILLEGFLTPGRGKIQVDVRSNSLIVLDSLAKMENIKALIQKLDVKEQEVLIEARIVQVALRDEFQMGIDWDEIIEKAHGLSLSSTWGQKGASAKASMAIGTLSDDNYRAVLEALGYVNDSHMLSKPRVAVVNNQEARILVGSTKPYVTTTTITPSTGPAIVSEEVKFIDVGVKLTVMPTIHQDGYITMNIRPEVSSATTFVTTGQGNVIPVVETSEVETVVRVKDGVTIMIGGLIREGRTQGDQKIPLLGDVPILGSAFRKRSQLMEKTEIVIFLTPRIISGDLR